MKKTLINQIQIEMSGVLNNAQRQGSILQSQTIHSFS